MSDRGTTADGPLEVECDEEGEEVAEGAD